MNKKSILAISAFGGSVAAAALLGVRFNPAPGTETGLWYRRLRKAPLNSPDAVFAPVWTALYTLMTIAAYRVWRAPEGRSRAAALRLWFTQLGLNAAWSPLFFGASSPCSP